MPYPDVVPGLAELIEPAHRALLGELTGVARQRRQGHASSGRYGDVLRGWSGQVEVCRARLVSELVAGRLTAENVGQSLYELAESESDAVLVNEPRSAVGEIVLTRSITNASGGTTGHFVGGVIKQGHRFGRAGNPDFVMPLEQAEFEAAEAVICGRDDTTPPAPLLGQVLHTQTVTVPIVASRQGPHANTPDVYGYTLTGQVQDPLFDAQRPAAERFAATLLRSSGGTLGSIDEQVRKLARAMARGFDGPTVRAALAGALSDPSVLRVLPFQDPERAVLALYAADSSWSMSAQHRGLLKQALYDFPWIGFGCRVEVLPVQNRPITARVTVVLRSKQYDAERSDITETIRATAADYFDNRPDFNVWRTSALGGRVAAADRRVLACTAVSVHDHATGETLPEPSGIIESLAPHVTHYLIVSDGVEVTYTTE